MPAEHEQPGGDADLDAAFAEIVAGWDRSPGEAVPRWPAGEDLTDGADPAAAEEPTDPVAPPTPDDQTGQSGEGPTEAVGELSVVLGPRDWEAPQVEEHFIPPEPPPLPRGSLITRLSWAAVLLGPAFLLLAGLFWRDVARLWLAVAVAAFVGGFAALVVRLPTHRDDDDDGAVV
jgi:hypothetical protein